MKYLPYILILFALPAFAGEGHGMSDFAQIISTVVLILTLLVMIVTFINAHRPHVGIIKSDVKSSNNGDLIFEVRIKNTGNVPAQAVKTSSRTYHGDKKLTELLGESNFILFPNQETYGHITFHGVSSAALDSGDLKISFLIQYEQNIAMGFTRNYETIQNFRFDPKVGNLAAISSDIG